MEAFDERWIERAATIDELLSDEEDDELSDDELLDDPHPVVQHTSSSST